MSSIIAGSSFDMNSGSNTFKPMLIPNCTRAPKSRNSKYDVINGTPSMSFCNNAGSGIQIMIPSTKSIKKTANKKIKNDNKSNKIFKTYMQKSKNISLRAKKTKSRNSVVFSSNSCAD